MRAHIIGSGEAFDSRYGNNSCLVTADGLSALLVDCGYQIPERLWRRVDLCERIDAVWITHLHADHAAGLGPLATRFWEEDRTRPLYIYGPRGIGTYVDRLLDFAYGGIRKKFRFDLICEAIDPNEVRQFGEFRMTSALSRHSITNLSVRIESSHGASLAISGDGDLTHSTRELYRNADVLLHECYSLGTGVPMHCNLENLFEFAIEEGEKIGRIGLTHISRNERATVHQSLLELARHDPRWFMAEPGSVLEIVPRGLRTAA